MTVVELGGLVAQFGLPLVMFFGVIILSIRGDIIWKPSHQAVVSALTDRLQDVLRERDRFADLAYKGVSAAERGAEVLKSTREGTLP